MFIKNFKLVLKKKLKFWSLRFDDMTIDCSLAPLLMNWQKGEEISEFIYAYIHVYILFMHILFIGYFLTLFDVWQKGGEVLVVSCFGFMCCIYLTHICFLYVHVSYFILNNRASFEGEFLPPFYILCYIAYMFCHHQKGGDCWPKRLHSPFI